ncbi:MAG: Nudix family hydrolase [Burkholderiaceae bacterium]|nr:Nudix family hydrolase [Burkholderiaceae bacterium]
MTDTRVIDVAAGVILRSDGQVLLGQRPVGKPWPGWWELPGGKVEPGETILQALTRELQEEIGITVTEATPWVTYVHAYPEKTVRLSFWRVTAWTGEPQGLESQALAWVHPSDAHRVGDLLPATLPVLRWLHLPNGYGITDIRGPEHLPAYLLRLDRALADGLRLVQFREPAWSEGVDAPSLRTAFDRVLARCRAAGARLLVNSLHPWAWSHEADGLHLRAADAQRESEAQARSALLATLPEHALLGVSVHSTAEVAVARRLEADFVVAGHVAATPSHPGEAGMGWDGFTSILVDAGLPAYAVGGQSRDTLAAAQAAGAHGVAGIRGLV